jgi:hypothetical protein
MQLLIVILYSAKVSWTPASKLTGLPFPLEARIFLLVIALSEGDRRVTSPLLLKLSMYVALLPPATRLYDVQLTGSEKVKPL